MAVGSAQVSVTTSTAAALTVTETDDRAGSSICVQNTDSTNPVYLGPSGVTSSTGFKLAAGAVAALDVEPGDTLYAIATGGTVVVHVLRSGV